MSVESPPPPPKPNQRAHPRYELFASVEVKGEETLVLPARNLSLGGLYVGADGHDLARAFPAGHPVDLVVFDAVDADRPALRGGARVVRHDEGGMALRWEEDRDTAQAIGRLLASLTRRG
jgi:hypothetical protein